MLNQALFNVFALLPQSLESLNPSVAETTTKSTPVPESNISVNAVGDRFYELINNSALQTQVKGAIDAVQAFLVRMGVGSSAASFLAWVIFLVVLIAFTVACHRIAKIFIRRIVDRGLRKLRGAWGDILISNNVLVRLAQLIPFIILGLGLPLVAPASLKNWILSFLAVYGLWVILIVGFGLIELLAEFYRNRTNADPTPIKGLVQGAKLVLVVVVILYVLSALFSKSPMWFLSGIGAFMALVLLIFRDSLLGFVAGIQLTTNDMVRVGDWIEIPGKSVDGEVLEVSLTTVRVSNWDRTIAMVPAYDLFQNTFINWRGMDESGGRRIKRSICLDISTIKFVTLQMRETWGKIALLQPYLKDKASKIEDWNKKHGATEPDDINARNLTNIGAFRAYVVAFLRASPHIQQEKFTFLVRQLQPTIDGIPIEIYVFSNDNRWKQYEDIQADIFDHLLAIVPLFELEVASSPSGSDVRAAQNPAAAAAAAAAADS